MTRRTLLGALAAALTSTGPADAVVVLDCKTAKALTRLPARPVWFPIPQPPQTTLIVNADAPPRYARGLKWASETRYIWLARQRNGGIRDDSGAQLVLKARFENLNRTISVRRLEDERLLAQWKTTAHGADTTTAVGKNITGTEFGQFLATLRTVQYPTTC